MFLQSRTHLVRFGIFEFDLANGELWKSGRRLKLQNQPCQVLKALVSRPGELVTREELKRELWPDETFVDFDSGLNVAIRKIRHALGDLAPSPRFIETERARGYRFIAPVTGPSDRTAEPQSEDGEFSSHVAQEAQLVTRDIHKDAARHGEGISRSAFAVLVLAITLIVPGDRSRMDPPALAGQVTYTQLTSFTDSAVAPVLSPDGRMVAFYRGDRWFLTPHQIWVKQLPSGELVQVTDFPGRKYGLAFSPDGARLAFSLAPQPSWRTFTVSPFGGKPELMMSNAAGLSWIDHDRLLFSEIRTGLHMGIVTSGVNRAGRRRCTSRNTSVRWLIIRISLPTADGYWLLKWITCRRGNLVVLSRSTAAPMAGSSGLAGVARQRHGLGKVSGCTSARKWMEAAICGDSVFLVESRSRLPSGRTRSWAWPCFRTAVRSSRR